MAVLATDDFNRANGGLGANWTNLRTNVFRIVSNQVESTDILEDAVAIWNTITWPADQYAQAAIKNLSGGVSGEGMGVSLRMSGPVDSITGYRVIVADSGAGNVAIERFASGAFSPITTRTTTWVSGDILKAQIEGTTIKVFQNGAQLGADITDANVATGSAGLSYSSALLTSDLDDFEGGDFTVPPTGASVAWIKA